MATLRKMRSKWQVIIRKKNYPTVVRSFIEKSTASKFAKDVETQMDKQIFQDLTGASNNHLKRANDKIQRRDSPYSESS